jgi:DNA-binding PadR family transcriptional regulator
MATRPNQRLAPSDLPTTSYAVLGLLTFGTMSGYDVKKVADQSLAFFFTPAKSQIYSELRRLVSLGYATEREVEQDRRPDKRLYRITDRGRRALRDWLDTAEVESGEIKSPFLVKVFFGAHMSREALLAQVKEVRRRDAEELQTLKGIETVIKDQEEMFFPYLTLKCGLAAARAVLRWEDEVIRELEKREGP